MRPDLQQLRDRVLAAVDIADCAATAGFVKRGRAWLCGFHSDKSPSASIRGNRIRCFACGESWDAISLTMRARGVGFTEALFALAQESGIWIPTPGSDEVMHYEAQRKAAEPEARRLVKWRHARVQDLVDERDFLLRTYFGALRFLVVTAQSTLLLPEDERVEAFLRAAPTWKIDLATFVIDTFELRLDEICAQLQIMRSASYFDLIPLFKASEGSDLESSSGS